MPFISLFLYELFLNDIEIATFSISSKNDAGTKERQKITLFERPQDT